MTTTHRPSAVGTSGAPGARQPALLVLAAVTVLLAVEDLADLLLLVPVGALAALALRRSGPLPVLIELAQTGLPGRVPDPVDVAATTAGAVVGVGPGTAVPALARRRGARRSRRALLSALLTAPLLLAGAAGCSSAGPTGAAQPTTTSDGSALTAADGYLPDGEVLSPFDDVPAITGLDGDLRIAVQDAARDAAAGEVNFHVTTGWRSAAYQQALFDAAVGEYGSPEAARAHVLRPDESAHVTGDAVDIGPTDAMYWLAQHGSDYGLCQTYGNEMWHFQLAVERGGECPSPAADPSADPSAG